MDTVEDEQSSVGKQHHKNRAKKRKRAKKFLHNAKGFGRIGSFGRGEDLDQSQYNYLLSILDSMGKTEGTEERQLMANNVLGQLEGKEIRTSSNQLGSRVLENLLTYADEETFARLMDTLAEHFRVVCCDSFASHVLQRVLYVAMLRTVAPLQEQPEQEHDEKAAELKESAEKKRKLTAGGDERGPKDIWPSFTYSLQEPYSDEHRRACGAFVERLAKFLVNNLEEFVWNCTANYVVRQCMLHLSGIAEMKVALVGGGAGTRDSGGDKETVKRLVVPESWSKLLHSFNLHLLEWPQFADLPFGNLTSIVLQTLLQAIANSNDPFQLEQLCTKLHTECFLANLVEANNDEMDESANQYTAAGKQEEMKLPQLFHCEGTVRLLEVCLSVASPEFLREKLFAELFRERLKPLALSRACNFAVQKLIDHTADKDTMETIFGELEGSLESILRRGHSGVVLALTNACVRLSCQQGKFIKQLLDALHCGDAGSEKLLTAVLYLMPANVTSATAPKIHIHGSLILQAILEFNKPIKFVTALLEMNAERLVEILRDPRGSFIANAFVRSRFVGEKSREKMVRHLEGQYGQLALTSHGSRVVELFYEAGNPAQRENIVRELSDSSAQLSGKPWGFILNKRLLIDTYKRDPARWKVAIKSDAKVERMFDKIVGGKKRKAQA
ncbi:nucleolar protein 9 [Anopheles darlingi]|uniref:nucleolar protein 9 n=1 Tax=Anopheles darlingi TaxID=43151 RepID=UPI0021004158|nr:nucleolar protein 9 [Anopheles darlingi]